MKSHLQFKEIKKGGIHFTEVHGQRKVARIWHSNSEWLVVPDNHHDHPSKGFPSYEDAIVYAVSIVGWR